jgi:glycine betaine/proline transport system ATP-binding protein
VEHGRCLGVVDHERLIDVVAGTELRKEAV